MNRIDANGVVAVMWAPQDKPPGWIEGCHDLLMLMAGWIPDELAWQARMRLDAHDWEALARVLGFGAVAYRVPLDEQAEVLLSELLGAVGEQLAGSDLGMLDDEPPYRFSPYEWTVDGHQALDLTGMELDRIDTVAVELVHADVDVYGLWRAWRMPTYAPVWPPPARVFLVETGTREHRHELAVRLGSALAAAGERDPRVEVWAYGDELYPYQIVAQSSSALLWSAEAAGPIQVASALPDDPAALRKHGRIDDLAERVRIASYLEGGEPVLLFDGRVHDVLDPARGEIVPVDLRTDGSWVWSDKLAYYLREHGLAPEAPLLSHILGNECVLPVVPSAGVFRAVAALESDVTSTR